MKLPYAFHDLPRSKFPLILEAYNPVTSEVVWSHTILEAPPLGERIPVYIPPLKKQLGYPVGVRVRYGDGSIEEGGIFG